MSAVERVMAAKKNVLARVKAALSAATSTCEEWSLAQFTKSLPSLMKSRQLRHSARRDTLLENVLVNLGLCHEISYRLNAEKLGIHLEGVFVRFIEDRTMNRLLDLCQNEQRSSQSIQVEVVIDSSVSESELASLKQIVDCNCPGLNVIRRHAPVQSFVRSSSLSVAAE